MSSPIQIRLTKNEVIAALEKALSQNFADNLRNRHPNVALDSKLRGFVGEIAFKKWAKQYNIEFEASNVKDNSSGMDIDFLFRRNEELLSLELKTSLIPDVDQDLEELSKRRDIKLIRRQNKPIEELEGDLHVQIVFKQLRMRKDEWLKKQHIDSYITTSESLEKIYRQLAAYRYETDTFLVAWIDKESLIQQINNKAIFLRLWKYGMREFWTCNLNTDAKEPLDLINYLLNEQ